VPDYFTTLHGGNVVKRNPVPVKKKFADRRSRKRSSPRFKKNRRAPILKKIADRYR
jgi:hypothetical protein